MGEPAGGFPPAVDPGLYGQTVQPMAQPQEGMLPPAQQPQGMIVPSQPQPGPRAGVPQMVGHSLAYSALSVLCPFTLGSASQYNGRGTEAFN